MINSIITQVIDRAVGQISDNLKLKQDKFIDEHNKDISWNKLVQEVITTTEDIDKEIGEYIFNQLSIKNLKKRLLDENIENIHRDFVLTLAVELCKFNKEKNTSISLGTALVDKWFEKNKISSDCDIYDVEEFDRIISDLEELYRNYFKLFEDKNGVDRIRVFYPKNGEDWIRWDEEYSIDINVNLSKGLAYGFSRVGFDYYRRIYNKTYKTLKYVYIKDGKEILRFNEFSRSDGEIIIWSR